MGYTWQYYDLVLLGISVSIAVGLAIGLLTPVGLMVSVPVAALVAVVIIGHGLFVNGPVDEPADLASEVESLK